MDAKPAFEARPRFTLPAYQMGENGVNGLLV
jgi:hypothetical protein